MVLCIGIVGSLTDWMCIVIGYIIFFVGILIAPPATMIQALSLYRAAMTRRGSRDWREAMNKYTIAVAARVIGLSLMTVSALMIGSIVCTILFVILLAIAIQGALRFLCGERQHQNDPK